MRRVTLPNAVLLAEAVRMLNSQHTVCIRAKGSSMLPFIIGGHDSVVLQQPQILHKGDIVLAEPIQGSYVLHRITYIAGDKVTLMGDGNLLQREQCTVDQIHAVAITIIRNGKHIDCNTRTERWKGRLWGASLPIRKYLLAVYKQLNN